MFEAAGEGKRRFAILFETRVFGTRLEDDPQWFIFDGQWLLEKQPKQKTYTKRQVVPPGQPFDPLKIGEGPFPIPIGQKRADIVARYSVELLAPDAGLDVADTDNAKLAEFTKGCYQLRLVPRADRPDRDRFSEIRLWYREEVEDGGRMLPRAARTIAVGAEDGEEGDLSIVRLINVRVNSEFDRAALDTATPRAEDGWDGQVIDFREPAR
jgi:hypothetical protein